MVDRGGGRSEEQWWWLATCELEARRRTVAMAATVMLNVASPGLQQLQWRVGEVEEMVAKLWARWIGHRCGGGGARAWRWDAAMATAVWLGSSVCERETESERVSERV